MHPICIGNLLKRKMLSIATREVTVQIKSTGIIKRSLTCGGKKKV